MRVSVLAGTAIPKISAFISYSHEDRQYARQAKDVLATFGINAFLAHEDIAVSHDWRSRILEELRGCELFLPLLSKNFLSSQWAPQEVGFMASRSDVAIIPVSIDGTIACGFISHIQSRRFEEEEVTSEFLLPALAHQFPRTILPHLIQSVKDARSFRTGEARLGQLVPFFSALTPAETKLLAENCIENSQIWDAALCRDEQLPEFLRSQGRRIGVKNRRALQYQIQHREWYRPEEHE